MLKRTTILLFFAISFLIISPVSARTWTAKSGHTVEGDFIKLEEGIVYIVNAEGKTGRIKLDLLSDVDQDYIKSKPKPEPKPKPKAETRQSPEPRGVPPLKVVVFVPADKEPLPDRHERLGRVMKYIQDWFRKEMERNGYGPKTFALEWDAPGKLKIYTVHGKEKATFYDESTRDAIRNEVRNFLKMQGINSDNETVLILSMLFAVEKADGTLDRGKVNMGYGPSPLATGETAWEYEDALLDSDLLSSNEPGGYGYNPNFVRGPVSIGRFNSIRIGTIAHELGHAFGCSPHDCANISEREKFGYPLMGGGQSFFGEELQGKGKGVFLSPASAMRLSTVRAFVGDLPNARMPAQWNLAQLKAVLKEDSDSKVAPKIILNGRVSGTPELIGLIAYNEDMAYSNYQTNAWTTVPQRDGTFAFEISDEFTSQVSELKTIPYQLRLVGVHRNGAVSHIEIDYYVKKDENGFSVDLSPFNGKLVTDRLIAAYNNGDVVFIKKVANDSKADKEVREKARLMLDWLQPLKEIDVTKLPKNIKSTDLTFARFDKAEVGWNSVRRGSVPESLFISLHGQFFKSGLFAHAPSVYEVNLDGKWDTLEIGYGLQDGHHGSIKFIVRGDGKELFQSDAVGATDFFIFSWTRNTTIRYHQKSINIQGIRTLELLVKTAKESNTDAWGVWVDPILKR